MDNKKAVFKKISDIAFIAGVLCEILVMPSGFVELYYGQKYIILLGMAAFALSLLFSMDLKRDWKILIPVFAFGALCYYFQKSALMLRLGLIIMAGRTQDKRKIIKFFFLGTAAWMLLAFVLSFFGMSGPLYLQLAFRHWEGEVRWCFGFLNPNGYAFFQIKLLILGLYLYGDKMKLWVRGLLFAVGLVPLIMAVTKAGLAAYVLFSAVCLYLAYAKDKDKSLKLLWYGGVAMMVFEMLLIFTLGIFPYPEENVGQLHNYWDLMNQITTGRLSNAREVLQNNVPPIMGSVGSAEAVSEIGFVDSLYREGVVFVAIYCVLLFALLYRLYKNKDRYGMFMLLCFTFYTVAESFLPYANKNGVWLLLIGEALLLKKEKNLSG